LFVAVTAVAFNHHVKIVPQVHAEETQACADQTLVGRYAFTGQGFFTTSNTLPASISAFTPAADVGVFASDGQGKLSGSDTISNEGQIIPRTFMGTYNVNSDCTGTASLQFNSGLTVDVAIVLDARGHEVRALQTNPQGAVFTVLAGKVR
jgi:hypothetical protein